MMTLDGTWSRVTAVAVLLGAPALACSHKEAQAEAPAVVAASAAVASNAPAAPRPPAHAPPVLGEISPKTQSACDDICGHSQRLHCKHTDECKPQCIAMGSFTPCKDEFVAFYRCLQGKPDSSWECGEDGVAAIREGLCDSEQEKAVGCMEAKMQPQ